MSDPFMPMEAEERVTLALLQLLADHGYPTVLSTKGVLAADEPYASLLARPNFAVQFSITSADDEVSREIDAGAPTTTERLRAAAKLADLGAKVAIRHQPLLPTRESEGFEVIVRAVMAGARHYAVEHLKLPVENDWRRGGALSRALGIDLREHYGSRNAERIGREWVLPIGERLDRVLSLKAAAHSNGLSFGAADNDLLHASDGAACCSGADLLGLGAGLQFNFLAAVRSGLSGDEISFGAIEQSWCPQRPISEYVNSHSRGPTNTVHEFIRSRWNGVANGPSPTAFYGVEDTGLLDASGLKVYRLAAEVRQQIASLPGPVPQPTKPTVGNQHRRPLPKFA